VESWNPPLTQAHRQDGTYWEYWLGYGLAQTNSVLQAGVHVNGAISVKTESMSDGRCHPTDGSLV
jgi:hypothetical protein